MAFGADDVETAGREDLFALAGTGDEVLIVGVLIGLRLGLDSRIGLGAGEPFGVAAEEDVGAAAGHVGGDGDRPLAPGLSHDRSLTLVVLGVQDDVGDPLALEHPGEHLALLDRQGADERRLALGVAVLDLLDRRVPFLARAAIDEVGAVGADHVAVGRDDDHIELVDVLELGGLGHRRAGHARELLVHAEEVLEGDRGERLVLALDLDALLRLDGLVQAVGPAAAGHHAAGELVDDDHLAVLDQVLDVAPVEVVRAQPLVDAMDQVHVLHVVEVVDAEELFHLADTLVGEGHGVRLLVHEEVAGGVLVAVLVLDLLAPFEPRDDLVDPVVLVDGLFGGPGDDQRRPRFVDEDRVDLVDDGEEVPPLHHGGEVELHVVAQVVEAELVVGAIGDVALVRRAPVDVGDVVLDDADREAQELVDAPHPFGVPARQVVVDRDDVDALAGEGVEVAGEGRDQGLALAGPHLGDLALVQDHAADQLDVVVAHAEDPARRLADDRESRHEEIVEALAGGELPSELLGLAAQRLVGERPDSGLEGVDRGDHRLQALDVALVFVAENLRDDLIQHAVSFIRRRRGRGARRRTGILAERRGALCRAVPAGSLAGAGRLRERRRRARGYRPAG